MLARVLYTFLVSVLLAMTLQPFASFSVAAQALRGTKVALVIGNNRYDQLAELRNPKRDAAAISDRLRARGFNVSELFDADAFAMHRAVDTFVRQAEGADIALFYFSGHGMLDEEGHLYFALKDTEFEVPRASSLSAEFVREAMDRTRSQRVVLILDCCHSGAFAKGMKGPATLALQDRFRID